MSDLSVNSSVGLCATLTQLCDEIEQTHHAFLRRELPRLAELISKVAVVHKREHVELGEVTQAFAELRAELEPHMMKEEQILFPAIRLLEAAANRPLFPFTSIGNPIRMMRHEHDNAGTLLRTIRELTHDFEIPDDACDSYVVMLISLRQLENDLHLHIHKENNLLFPKSLQLESALADVR